MEQADNGRTYIEEIEAALKIDGQRLGDVFKARQADPDKDAMTIAEELGLGTTGTVYAALRGIETLVECRVRRPIGPTSAAAIARMLRGFARRYSDILSGKTQERLRGLAAEHDRIARDEAEIDIENEQIEREVESAKQEAVSGIYVYSYGHYLRFPILEARDAEINPRTFLKVGRSKDMIARIKKQDKTNMPEPPLILRMYTVPEDDLIETERRLHDHLKAAGHGRLWKKGTGKEWFLTQLEFLDSTSDLLGLELYRAHDEY